ncbi:hypothetical protein ACTXT7_001855 [Hymenolepis weldensis]
MTNTWHDVAWVSSSWNRFYTPRSPDSSPLPKVKLIKLVLITDYLYPLDLA